MVLKLKDELYLLQDPEVQAAFQDVAADPANISKYENNPKVKKVLEKLAGNVGGGGGAGAGGFPGFPGAGGAGGFPGFSGGDDGGAGASGGGSTFQDQPDID